MLYCYGKISTTCDHVKFIELWNVLHSEFDKQPHLSDSIKNMLLTVAEMQIKSDNVLHFLRDIMNTSIVNDREKLRMDNIIELHEFAIITDQTILWRTFWNKYKPTDMDDVFKVDFVNELYHKELSLIRILPELNYQIPLDISETSTNLHEKYIFVLFSNIIAMNTLNSLNQPTESFDLFFSKLESATKTLTSKFVAEYPDFLSKKLLNYNQILFVENKIKLKQIKEYYKKKKQDEERLRSQHGYSSPSSNILSADNVAKVKIIRPEDQGEDFSVLDNVENFTRLTTSDDKYARWKAAKVLGSRFLVGEYKPTIDEQKKIDTYVAFLLTQFKTTNPGDAGDASQQLWRLWSLAIPGLLEGLKSKDQKTTSVATQHLVMLRNREVIEKLINEYDSTKDDEYKKALIYTTGKMRTMHDNQLPYRKMMNSKKSAELAAKLITPFLERINATEKSEILQKEIRLAQKTIANPTDSRAYIVDPTTGKETLMIEEIIEDEKESTESKQPKNQNQDQSQSQSQPQSKNLSRNFVIGIVVLAVIFAAVVFVWRRKTITR
ncbi:MAG: hypothetical protein LBQ66_12135 [Planctomycetaceae bacterium]|nr:hypothetical protein [Planctomycetaceae bacterium]